MKVFQAYGTGDSVYGDTPQEAALSYFLANPRSRKCSVVQGTREGAFFTVAYGRASEGNWPESYRDITRKQAEDPATFGRAGD